MGKFLDKYIMAQSHSHFVDSEGFYDLLRERSKAKSQKKFVYFPNDIIRNRFSLEEKELRKEKWIVYNKVETL